MLLKQEIKNLHSLIEASPTPAFQYITREQCIVPAEVSHKDVANIQRVPSAALPAEALPAISIPAGMTLSYRDVAAAGFHPLALQRYLILRDLKPLCTERRPPPALLLLKFLL
jgi:hypothetical protein